MEQVKDLDDKDLRAKNSCQAWQKAARKHNDINEKTMTTLKQIRKKNGSCYTSPNTGVPLYTERDIEEWLQQKHKTFTFTDFDRGYNEAIKELVEELET